MTESKSSLTLAGKWLKGRSANPAGRPIGSRVKPNAASSLGVSIGLAAGYPIVTFLMTQFGWRESLWALAFLNLAIGLPLVLTFIQAGAKGRTPAVRDGTFTLIRKAFGSPHLAPIPLIEIATLSYLWGTSTWLPAYLREAHHFSHAEMSIFRRAPLHSQLAGDL